MSADLLAEFDSFYSPPSQPQQQDQNSSNPAPSQPTNPASDPFAFLSPTTTSPAPAQASFQSQPWPTFQTQPSTAAWGDLSGLGGTANTQQSAVDEDEDDFGDFEEAPSTQHVPQRTSAMSFNPTPMAPVPKPGFAPKTRIVRASTMDLMTNNLVDLQGLSSKPEPWQQKPSWERASEAVSEEAKPPPKPKNADPNVLFDADDFNGVAPEEDDDEDDDFGDFETGDSDFPKPVPAPAPKPTPAPAFIDLMSTDYEAPAPAPTRKQPPSQLLSTLNLNVSPTSPYPHAPRSPSYQERNPFPGMGIVTPVSAEFPKDDEPKSPSPITAWPSMDHQPSAAPNDDFGDDWGAFDDLPPEPVPVATAPAAKHVAKSAPKQAPEPAESNWDWDAVEPVETSTPQNQDQAKAASALSSIPDSAPPPTNIPPPSILLSIFPSLLSQASASLFQPAASQPAPVRARVLASPEAAAFLRAYLLLATVAARVLAGRKLRWHRDKFLAQGMSISAAGGSRGGGMKLAGVDKAQSAREDREAADVVALWQEGAGRLRSAVAAVNTGRKGAGAGGEGPPLLHMPELGAHMAVQTAKMVPTAPKPCAVCGLRRDERVKGADFEVEDSFGEWWVEHWGHRACRNFWLEHEAQLRSR